MPQLSLPRSLLLHGVAVPREVVLHLPNNLRSCRVIVWFDALLRAPSHHSCMCARVFFCLCLYAVVVVFWCFGSPFPSLLDIVSNRSPPVRVASSQMLRSPRVSTVLVFLEAKPRGNSNIAAPIALSPESFPPYPIISPLMTWPGPDMSRE